MFNHHEVFKFNPSPHSPHTKIVNWVGYGKQVLDVGCASGYIGERLKQKGCQVIGIEVDEATAQVARETYDEVVMGNVETMEELPYPDSYFDVMIFSDVLEHLKRPDWVLTRFKKYLKPDGFVIASIPNIARLEFRLKLLFGRFDYEDSGILSKGHLRFFTLQTAQQLFEGCGYEIQKVDYTGLGSRFHLLPTWLAYQFFIIASPKG